MGACRIDRKIFHVWSILLLILVHHHWWLSHTSISKAVKNVDVAGVVSNTVGYILKHGVGELRQDFVDLAKQKRHKTVIIIPENREDIQQRVEVFSGARREGIARGGMQGKYIRQGAGDVE